MMKRAMKFMSVGLLVVAAAACGAKDDPSAFRAGVPDKSAVTLNAPNKAGAQVGDASAWWLITFSATTGVNTGVLAILDLIHSIVELPPTSHPSANVYVWGPGNGSALDPNVYRLTVTDTGNSVYTYNLDAKGKNDADSAFVTILSGTHTPVVTNGTNDPVHGNGDFLLDWDKRKTLAAPPTDSKGRPLQGNWNVTYDHKTADVTVDVQFNDQLNDAGQTVSASYHYSQPAGGDGKFQFATDADVNNNGSALEHVAVESRWKQDGSGRSDITISGGDMPTGGTAQGNECWDTNFKVSFDNLVIPTTTDPVDVSTGAETSCPFVGAEYYGG